MYILYIIEINRNTLKLLDLSFDNTKTAGHILLHTNRQHA